MSLLASAALALLAAASAPLARAAAPHSIVDHAGGESSIVATVSRACTARCQRPAAVNSAAQCDEFRGDSRFPQRLSICNDSFKAGHRWGCDAGCMESSANNVCFGLKNNAAFIKARESSCSAYDKILPRPTMINVCRDAFGAGAEARCSDSVAWALEEYAHLEAEALVRATEDAATRARAMEDHLYEAAAAEQRRLAAEARQHMDQVRAMEDRTRRTQEAAAAAAAADAAAAAAQAEQAAVHRRAEEEAKTGKTRGAGDKAASEAAAAAASS